MVNKKELPIFLEGEKLYLCPHRREDAPLYMKWFNDEEVTAFLLMHRPLTLEQELEIMDKILRTPISEGFATGMWTKEPLKLIGVVGLHQMDSRNQYAELGIVIGDKSEWNKGYGREAINLVMKYGFETLNLRKIYLRHFGPNKRARALYDKLGFKEVGRLVKHRFIQNQWGDEVLMEIFKEEFSALNP